MAKNLWNFWNKLLGMTPYKIFCDNKLLRTGNFSYKINKYPIQTIIFAFNRGTNNDGKFISKFFYAKNPIFFAETNFHK